MMNPTTEEARWKDLLSAYRPIASSGIPPREFYDRVRGDGVSKLNVFVVLRDRYNFSLMECVEIGRASTQANGQAVKF